jgi:hypothetical protein
MQQDKIHIKYKTYFYLIVREFFPHNIKYSSVHGGNKSCCIYILAWLTNVTLSIRKKRTKKPARYASR